MSVMGGRARGPFLLLPPPALSTVCALGRERTWLLFPASGDLVDVSVMAAIDLFLRSSVMDVSVMDTMDLLWCSL